MDNMKSKDPPKITAHEWEEIGMKESATKAGPLSEWAMEIADREAASMLWEAVLATPPGRKPTHHEPVTNPDHQTSGAPEIAVDGLKNAEKTFTLHGMCGIEILREIEYQHREGERCSLAYLN